MDSCKPPKKALSTFSIDHILSTLPTYHNTNSSNAHSSHPGLNGRNEYMKDRSEQCMFHLGSLICDVGSKNKDSQRIMKNEKETVFYKVDIESSFNMACGSDFKNSYYPTNNVNAIKNEVSDEDDGFKTNDDHDDAMHSNTKPFYWDVKNGKNIYGTMFNKGAKNKKKDDKEQKNLFETFYTSFGLQVDQRGDYFWKIHQFMYFKSQKKFFNELK